MNKPDADRRLPLRNLDTPLSPLLSPLPAGQLLPGAVCPGSRITLNFSLKLDQHQVIDSNFDREPVSFVIGDGSMLPGFERALSGKVAGDKVEVLIPAAEAFGEINPDNQQRFPRFQFPPDMALTENLMVEFADARGYQQAGRVVHIGKDQVEIDFNHPLAGRGIWFSASILRVEKTS